MARELARTDDKQATVSTMLAKLQPQIKQALPKHLTDERMLRVVRTAISRQPRLLECTPISLAGAIIEASQLGLEPDGVMGMAHLVAFRNNRNNTYECQLITGYQGLMELARRSGRVSTYEAHVVYEADDFDWTLGTDKHLSHRPCIEDRGIPVAVYAIAALPQTNGDTVYQFHVMSVGDVNKVRDKYSRAAGRPDSAWTTHWPEMAMKTAARQLYKWLPKSAELSRAVALEEMMEAGVPQNLGTNVPVGIAIDIEKEVTPAPAPTETPEPEPVAHKPEPEKSEPEPVEPDPAPPSTQGARAKMLANIGAAKREMISLFGQEGADATYSRTLRSIEIRKDVKAVTIDDLKGAKLGKFFSFLIDVINEGRGMQKGAGNA